MSLGDLLTDRLTHLLTSHSAMERCGVVKCYAPCHYYSTSVVSTDLLTYTLTAILDLRIAAASHARMRTPATSCVRVFKYRRVPVMSRGIYNNSLTHYRSPPCRAAQPMHYHSPPTRLASTAPRWIMPCARGELLLLPRLYIRHGRPCRYARPSSGGHAYY